MAEFNQEQRRAIQALVKSDAHVLLREMVTRAIFEQWKDERRSAEEREALWMQYRVAKVVHENILRAASE